jgi:hypothetical protein
MSGDFAADAVRRRRTVRRKQPPRHRVGHRLADDRVDQRTVRGERPPEPANAAGREQPAVELRQPQLRELRGRDAADRRDDVQLDQVAVRLDRRGAEARGAAGSHSSSRYRSNVCRLGSM